MKKLFLLFFLLKFSVSFSQIDTCPIDNTVCDLYYYDAVDLALDTIANDPLHPYHDSIHLPKPLINRILRGFNSVYQLNIPERDTIVNLFNIHYLWGNPLMVQMIRNSIVMGLDTNYSWVQQFIQDSIHSGNPEFDSLVADLGFKMVYKSAYFNDITIRTDSAYNLQPLVALLASIPGVIYALEVFPPGFGGGPINYPDYHSTPDYDELIFTHCWDCFDGCAQQRKWKFHIFPDCSAQFIESWGNQPIVPAYGAVSGTLTYDNVSSSYLNNCMVQLINDTDTLIQFTNSQGYFYFSNVPNGTYQLKAYCTKPWGGGNAVDALKVMQHFVGFSVLPPFKALSARVEGNTYSNSIDALAIMKRFVGMINGFIAGDWLIESANVTVTGMLVTKNLKTLCFGDVDGSYVPGP